MIESATGYFFFFADTLEFGLMLFVILIKQSGCAVARIEMQHKCFAVCLGFQLQCTVNLHQVTSVRWERCGALGKNDFFIFGINADFIE